MRLPAAPMMARSQLEHTRRTWSPSGPGVVDVDGEFLKGAILYIIIYYIFIYIFIYVVIIYICVYLPIYIIWETYIYIWCSLLWNIGRVGGWWIVSPSVPRLAAKMFPRARLCSGWMASAIPTMAKLFSPMSFGGGVGHFRPMYSIMMHNE